MTYYPLLGVRTDFSLGESIVSLADLPAIAEKVETNVVGVVETMSLSSLIEGTKKLAKVDKRLLTGVRIRVILAAEKDAKEYYLKLYPVNEDGIRSLYRVISRGFEADRFYYVPRVTWDDLAQLLSDDCLAISTGDANSVIQSVEHSDALTHLASVKRFCVSFIELVPSDTPYFSQQNQRAIEFAGRNAGWEPLVVMPTLWVEDDDMETFSINAGIAERRPYEDYLRPVTDYAPQSVKQLAHGAVRAAGAIMTRYGHNPGGAFAQGLANQQRLVDLCAYKWAKQEPILPIISPDSDAVLRQMCINGFRERFSGGKQIFGHCPTPQEIQAEYFPRFLFELDTLTRLGFSQYFLLVADLVRWSKSQGIYVGPGRGSVGGSLIAYLIGITDVDPIRFKLLFERFINPDRLDLPDADLDFMSTRRDEVIAYLEQRWGSDRVAGIVNYNTMGARSAIKDVGRVYNMPADQLGVTKFIGDSHGISDTLEEAHATSFEVQEFARLQPRAWRNALRLEGKMRAFGTHAAGVVVAGCDLTERAVVERRGGAKVINWDKRVSEEQGLIKLDVLGLSTLDMFDQAIKLIFKRHTKRIDINAIPLDDAETLEIFNQGKTQGVFQFEGNSVRRLLKDMARDKPLSFEDLVALNALNRPGPLDAGLAESYIKRRAGKEAVTYPHPVLEPILKDTYGVIAFQEQVMQVARTLCGFTPGGADTLRKIMGKKLPAEMAKLRDQFVDGAESTSNIDRGEADELFTVIEGFAGYAFNRSHSAAYTLIAYQAAYLKAHYLVEFYSAQMGTTKDDKLAILAKQAASDGIRVIPPDINVSTHQFEPLNDVIIAAPLNAVMGVSEKGVTAIVEARSKTAPPTVIETVSGRGKAKVTTSKTYGPGRFVSIEDFQARVAARAVNSRALDNLNRVGAFARIEPGQLSALHQSRQKDQIELMPAIADQGVSADRVIDFDDLTADAITTIEEDMSKALPGSPQACFLGCEPKMMFVLDAPFNDYEGLSKQFSYQQFVAPALHKAGLTIEDAVWTWVLRRPLAKGETNPSPEEIGASLPFLQREIAVMKPPVIVLLGTIAIKQFFPDMKKPGENIGHKAFSAALDATMIVGFKPTRIYHDAGLTEKLTEIFAEAKNLTE